MLIHTTVLLAATLVQAILEIPLPEAPPALENILHLVQEMAIPAIEESESCDEAYHATLRLVSC